MYYAVCIYEGCPINKLQSGIILLIFKMGKIKDVYFVGNLILNASCEFCYNDITVTSVINMATLPLKASHKEERSVSLFLWRKT